MPYSYSTRAVSGQPRREGPPSVWPVYLMCVLMGLFGLSALSWIWFLPWMAHAPLAASGQQLSPGVQAFQAFCVRLVPYAPLFGIFGALGLVAAVGAWLFRPWGWWCAALWVPARLLWSVGLNVTMVTGGHFPISPLGITLSAVELAFFVWVLVSRRQLFFRGT